MGHRDTYSVQLQLRAGPAWTAIDASTASRGCKIITKLRRVQQGQQPDIIYPASEYSHTSTALQQSIYLNMHSVESVRPMCIQ